MNRLSLRCSLTFRLALLLGAILTAYAFGSRTSLQSAELPSRETSAPVKVSLEYQDTTFNALNIYVAITSKSAPFKKEPPMSGKAIRGVMSFDGGTSNAMAFVWEQDAGKLILDLNRNEDLSDDTNGVFSTSGSNRSSYQTFTNVPLPLNTAHGRCQLNADLNFFGSGSRPICNLSVHSFWQGKVTLAGKDWQIGLIPSLAKGIVSFESGKLLLRPWSKHTEPFGAPDGSLDRLPFSQKLFVDGHAYQLTSSFEARDGQLQPALELAEQPVALGDLQISGKFIQRLVLPGGPFLVVLNQPASNVKVPVGRYDAPEVLLEADGVKATSSSSSRPKFSVDAKMPATLAAGGPLTNSVAASRHGQDLRLDYRLVGAGGAAYQLVSQNRSVPPQFAIYKEGKRIASGKFEFG